MQPQLLKLADPNKINHLWRELSFFLWCSVRRFVLLCHD